MLVLTQRWEVGVAQILILEYLLLHLPYNLEEVGLALFVEVTSDGEIVLGPRRRGVVHKHFADFHDLDLGRLVKRGKERLRRRTHPVNKRRTK